MRNCYLRRDMDSQGSQFEVISSRRSRARGTAVLEAVDCVLRVVEVALAV